MQLFSIGRRTSRRKLVGIILIITAGLVVTAHARGAAAYLPSIGPAPLRIEPEPAPGTVPNWKPLLLPATRPVENTNPPAPAVEALTANTNDIVIKVASSPATNATTYTNTNRLVAVVAANSDDESNLDVPSVPMIFPVTSDDLTSPVTPQILAEYFKPNPGREGKDQSGTSLFMPIDVGFTPPAPMPATPSQAVYKIE